MVICDIDGAVMAVINKLINQQLLTIKIKKNENLSKTVTNASYKVNKQKRVLLVMSSLDDIGISGKQTGT